MLTEAANSSGSESSADSLNSQHDEHEELCRLRAENLDLVDQMQALVEENSNLACQKSAGDRDLVDLKNQLQHSATELSGCKKELDDLRVENAWTERTLAIRNRAQTVLTQHQRAFDFS
jgi:chromosome segregation ATPase